MTNSSCKLLTIRDTLTGVPTIDGKRFATIFEHDRREFEVKDPNGYALVFSKMA